MGNIEQQKILGKWLEKHKGLLFKIVRAYAFNDDDRDDLFQEIIIQVWRSIPGFREESAVTTWLYRIALNTAIKWTQKERKHRDGRQSLEQMTLIPLDSSIQADDRLAWLFEEIARLNEIDRSVTLLLLDGFSYKEMAEITGISESLVGVKINRIKKRLTIQSTKNNYHGI